MFKVTSLTKCNISSTPLFGSTHVLPHSMDRIKDGLIYTLQWAFSHRLTRKQITIITALIILAGLAMGAMSVSSQMINRPRKAEIAREEVRGWGETIAASLSPVERTPWEELIEQDPALVLEICSVTLSASR